MTDKPLSAMESAKKKMPKKAWPLYDWDCLKCGAPLHLAKTHEGKTIPLDLRAHIYCIVYDRSRAQEPSQVVRTELCYVSHFFTCPYSNEFSGSRPMVGAGERPDGSTGQSQEGTVPVETGKPE